MGRMSLTLVSQEAGWRVIYGLAAIPAAALGIGMVSP